MDSQAMIARAFPVVLIFLQIIAGIVYATVGKDAHKAIYWFAAAVVNAAVTF